MNGSETSEEKIFAALWVGSPQSIREHNILCDGLFQTTVSDHAAPGPVVVFEDEFMPIDEIIEAFTTDSEFVHSALSSARHLGITQVSMGVVLFSSTGEPLWSDKPPSDGLVFLGIFPFPAEDVEEH